MAIAVQHLLLTHYICQLNTCKFTFQAEYLVTHTTVILLFLFAVARMEEKIIAAVITFQSCKVLLQRSINCCPCLGVKLVVLVHISSFHLYV